MTRINLLLLAALVACALSLVTSRHEARRLTVEIEREQARARQFAVEYGQLERNPALDRELITVAALPRLFEKAGKDHVRDPCSNTAFAYAKLLCVRARVPRKYAR